MQKEYAIVELNYKNHSILTDETGKFFIDPTMYDDSKILSIEFDTIDDAKNYIEVLSKPTTYRLSLLINRMGQKRQCKTIENTFSVDSNEEYMEIRESFFDAMRERGWKRVSCSATQLRKNGRTLTPFFSKI